MFQNHQPVLLKEAVDALVTDKSGRYVDGTFGRGGHSREIMSRLDGGSLFGIDRDLQAIAVARAMQADSEMGLFDSATFRFSHSTISALGEIELLEVGGVSGVLFDLGISSPQIDQAERGFSFSKDGPLDMRMDNSSGETAADVVRTRSAEELADIFYAYGEERKSRYIARSIVEKREESAFETTSALASFIVGLLGWREGKQHPALRCFQALRIYVNQELQEIEKGIEAAAKLLKKGGRLVVISFHSLEDRIVKRAFNPAVVEMMPGIPAEPEVATGFFKQLGKAIKPTDEEVSVNPRSRSAIMRIGVRQ